jgi:hypothetical protein
VFRFETALADSESTPPSSDVRDQDLKEDATENKTFVNNDIAIGDIA